MTIMNKKQKMMNARGFSLVELLVALLLGLLVLGAVVQLFVGSRTTQSANYALAAIQEDGRFMAELLKAEFRDVHTRGFCGSQKYLTYQTHFGGNADLEVFFDPGRPIQGWEHKDTGRSESFNLGSVGTGPWTMGGDDVMDLPSAIQAYMAPGSDAVLIRRVIPVSSVWALEGVNSASSNEIQLNAPHGLGTGTILLVTDCQTMQDDDGQHAQADLFQNQGGGSTLEKASALNWATEYQNSMQLFRVVSDIYFVGEDDPDPSDPDKELLGLYRARMNKGLNDPLIERLSDGAETLQVLYGFSKPGQQGGDGQSVNHWLTAAEVPDWRFVVAARLSLVQRSAPLAGGPNAQRFRLGWAEFEAADDRRMRHVFEIPLSLRNQQLMVDDL